MPTQIEAACSKVIFSGISRHVLDMTVSSRCHDKYLASEVRRDKCIFLERPVSALEIVRGNVEPGRAHDHEGEQ